jgi:hypothetical protein
LPVGWLAKEQWAERAQNENLNGPHVG